MRGVVLATLLDLCDNPKTLSHVMTWTGSGGRTAPALLLLLWREEEAELGVGRDQHGRISGQAPAPAPAPQLHSSPVREGLGSNLNA
jgi:hypothetical protein